MVVLLFLEASLVKPKMYSDLLISDYSDVLVIVYKLGFRVSYGLLKMVENMCLLGYKQVSI